MTTRHKDMVKELLEHDPDDDGKRLTDWEIKFIEKLDRQDHRCGLTKQQIAKLEEIWEKIFA